MEVLNALIGFLIVVTEPEEQQQVGAAHPAHSQVWQHLIGKMALLMLATNFCSYRKHRSLALQGVRRERREARCEKGRHRRTGSVSFCYSQKLMLSEAEKEKIKPEELILLAACPKHGIHLHLLAPQQLDIPSVSLSPLGPWGRS